MKSTRAKKLLSLLIVLCLVTALIPASLVSADSADIKHAVNELNQLPKEDKEKIINAMWKYMGDHIKDPDSITEDDILNQVKKQVPDLISTEAKPGDNKISEAAVRLIIQKVFVRRTFLVDLYTEFNGKGYLSKLKFLMGVKDEGELFAKMLANVKNSSSKLITIKNNMFVANTAQGQSPIVYFVNVATGFNIADNSEFSGRLAEANKLYTDNIEKLNSSVTNYGLTQEDIIYILRDVFGVLDISSIPTTPPTNTPTPSPTPSPTPKSGGGGGGGGGAPQIPPLSNALKELDGLTDPTTIKDVALGVINNAAEDLKKAQSEGKSTEEIIKVLKEVVAKAMEKVSVATVKATAAADGAKAVVTESEAALLTTRIDKILSTAKELTEAMKKIGVDTKVNLVLNIKIEADATAKAIQIDLPASVLKAAADKKLEKVAIDTGVSKLIAAPDALVASDAKTVTFAAKKQDAGTLTDAVKKFVGNDQLFTYELLADGKKVQKFAKPVEVVMPYSVKAGEDAKKATVYYVDDQGKTENVAGDYDAAAKAVRFTTNHFSGYVARVNNITFSDLASVEWARENIEVMAAKGFINGVGSGAFAPEANITRAEFAAMMVRTFKLQDAAAKNAFSDIKDSDWFSGEVASAVKAGLIKGMGDGIFAPNENITRQDMAVIVARTIAAVKAKAAPQNASQYIEKFKDKNGIADYAKDGVAAAVKYEIVKGITADTFVPEEQATRAQAAAMMYRMYFLN